MAERLFSLVYFENDRLFLKELDLETACAGMANLRMTLFILDHCDVIACLNI
jgi:hypothetical protein